MRPLDARLERLEARAPSQPRTPGRALQAIVSDPEALAMAERLRAVRASGRLTEEEIHAFPGLAELAERLRAKDRAGALAEGSSPWA